MHADSTARLDIANRSFGRNRAVFDKEVKFDVSVDGADLFCLDKNATNTKITNSRGILGAAAAPEDPNALGIDALMMPARMNNLFFQGRPAVANNA